MADDEKDRLIDHQYDGIQEYDNPLPRWWVITFWATIIFSVAYALNVGGIGTGQGRIKDYEQDMAAFRAAHPQDLGPADPAKLLALVSDTHEVSEGQKVYAKNCAACHAADGGGLIGPNLTDAYWIHGGKIEQIHGTVVAGVLAKGMPAWGKLLPGKEVDEVTAYIWTLQGTTPAKPKAPEGDMVAK